MMHALVHVGTLVACIAQAETADLATSEGPLWIPIPDKRIQVNGLPYFDDSEPRFWRLPPASASVLPKRVDALMRYPTGARIRLRSNTTSLKLKVTVDSANTMRHMSPTGVRGFDAYVDGRYWATAILGEELEQTLTLFDAVPAQMRDITIYLPPFQRVESLSVGVGKSGQLEPPAAHAETLPVVFYGSSIAQGACAGRPAMSYEAIVARALNVDFVNFGFSGSGKAEPEVVALVAGVPACCYVFDLGKSYGMQPPEVYARMLEDVRKARPGVPFICITPVFSTRESYNTAYADLSRHVREATADAANQRIAAGDDALYLVDGLELLGPDDADGFQEGVHPNDLGFSRIAERLEPVLRRALKERPAR